MKFNWYPGHMEKARKELSSSLKLVDFVIELVDSRIPYSSKNPLIDQLTSHKPKLIVFTKQDLCDTKESKKWIKHYQRLGNKVISINTLKLKNTIEFKRLGEKLCIDKRNKEKRKGIKPQPLKTMVVGIPNVGKSTFINYFVSKKITAVANFPGKTRNQKWVRLDKDVHLIDTPGILWPKIQDQQVALHLAMTNSIKFQILPQQEVFINALKTLARYYPKELSIYLNSDDFTFDNVINVLKKRYTIKTQNNSQELIVSKFLHELINGKIGNFTFDRI